MMRPARKNPTWFNSLTFYFSLAVFLVLAATMSVLFGLFAFLQQHHWLPSLNLVVLLLILAFLSVLIGTLFSLYFIRIPLRPFLEINEAMQRVAQGDFSVRLDYRSPYELEQFSRSFNRMTTELGSTEILRSDFINSFSHEFKTPIISIKGFAALLKNQQLTEAERQEYLAIILEESERLSELSTNVLNLTKLENTEILTDKIALNPAEQIRRCLVLLENRWEKKNLQIDLALIDTTLQGSSDLLQQVWLNLLDNAIKFSQENGVLHIAMIETAQFVSIVIKDEGIGMNEEETQQVLRKFYQTKEGQQQGGNGLGLSVVKRIIELHQGILLIESAPHQGTSVTVSLPH